jgi:16S rRNA G966 N2-methylase RsmD
MSGCCSPGPYGDFFDEKLARRDAERYRKKGLGKASEALVDLVASAGVEGASVLEIGGGTGSVEIELLRRGAARATNLELSPGYETEAQKLLRERGLEDRVDRSIGDIVEEPELAPEADVVVLHRVVCCYPDYAALLAAASSKARRFIAFSFPPDYAIARFLVGVLNLGQRLRGSAFRSYVHPEYEMLAAVEKQGLRLTTQRRSGVWRMALLERG